MRIIGFFVLFFGIIFGIYAFGMDTSIKIIDGLYVDNIGLLNKRTNYFIVSGFLCLIGTLFFIFSTKVNFGFGSNQSYDEWESEQELNKQIEDSYKNK